MKTGIVGLVALFAFVSVSACGGDTDEGGTGGNTTSSGSGGATTSSGSGGATTSSGSGGSAPCDPGCESGGFTCCDGTCVNPNNDINNCGDCGVPCQGANPYCDMGTCGDPPCEPGTSCNADNCCGTECCGQGELCCTVPGPVATPTECTLPTDDGTCPMGCLLCACAAPNTPIATPDGDRPIADLQVGDLVYSLHRGQLVTVPIKRVNRRAARPDHQMTRVMLAGGVVLEISPGHPTADGRTFADLLVGDSLQGQAVVKVERVPYRQPYTHDILPESDTGAYFAGGALVGSTLSSDAVQAPEGSFSAPGR